MQLRPILISSFQEFDNDVTPAIPVDFFKKKLLERKINDEDFEIELKAALRDGDFSFASPGMLCITQFGEWRYPDSLSKG